MKKIAICTVLIILLYVSMQASAQSTCVMSRSVITSGGIYGGRLVGAIGQPVVGLVRAYGSLCSGFWCEAGGSLALVGKAIVTYRWTFDEISITAGFMLLVALVCAKGLYNMTSQFWMQRRGT